ncbi:hypothetical protein [Streptomyces lavendofoliae]|uniref:hypothetical protein n=1 Tax=Streptomyces lavendofoliae TaxID=67314 RepID=UPI0016736AA3|nr:hypothetical protein [Streptomyces lavendofoliae]
MLRPPSVGVLLVIVDLLHPEVRAVPRRAVPCFTGARPMKSPAMKSPATAATRARPECAVPLVGLAHGTVTWPGRRSTSSRDAKAG